MTTIQHKLINTITPINEGIIPPLIINNLLISVYGNTLYFTNETFSSKPIKFQAEIKQLTIFEEKVFVLTSSTLYSIDHTSFEKLAILKTEADFYVSNKENFFIFINKNNIVLFDKINKKFFKKKCSYNKVKPVLINNNFYLINNENFLICYRIDYEDFCIDLRFKTQLHFTIKQIEAFENKLYLLNEDGNLFNFTDTNVSLIKELQTICGINYFQIFDNKIAVLVDGEIKIYKLNDGLFVCNLKMNGYLENVHLNLPYLVSDQFSISIIKDFQINYEIQSISEVSDIVFLKESNKLLVAANHLFISDSMDFKRNIFVGKKILQTDAVLSIKFDSINKLVFICTGNRWKVYDSDCMKLLHEHINQTHQINAIDIIQHGDTFYLATVSKDKTIQLLTYTFFKKKLTFTTFLTKLIHDKEINCLKFLIIEGTLFIATGSNDKTIKVHSMTGKLTNTLKNHLKGIWSLEVFKNFLVSSSTDTTVCIYDLLKEFQIIQKIEEHKSPVVKILTVPQGFYSSDLDGIIKYFSYKKGVFKLKDSSNLSTERIWSIFDFNLFTERVIGACDADGAIYILKNIEKENKELAKLKEVEEKERDFHLKTLNDFHEKFKLLFKATFKNEDYFWIDFLNENINNIKENETDIIKILKTNMEKTLHLLHVLSRNVKNLEIFIFLLVKLNDKKIAKLFEKQINKYFEFVENLNIDLIECEILLK
ncbi:putative U3 small nucleolar RNA-associated protein 13 [Cucumispora dikerogammari]|nr:putative U3 small nucleolar RNA-associated protein 13 [Cucumispora dikerogammari]